jgi:hypothetical protein
MYHLVKLPVLSALSIIPFLAQIGIGSKLCALSIRARLLLRRAGSCWFGRTGAIWLSVLLAGLFVQPRVAISQSVTTQQFDNSRQGIQSQETLLTSSNVNSSLFGKLFSLPVMGHVYAQPLYLPGLQMADGTKHNVLIVATERDYVYAFDADGNNPAQGYLWRDFLAGANETWLSWNDVHTSDIYPDIGITGTPVIDPNTNTFYVVAKTKTQTGTLQFFQRLHALNLADGTETLNGPTLIQATATGSGDNGMIVSFNPVLNNQRAGLLLAPTPNGASLSSVFITWASHGDYGPYHGWVISYNAADISQQTGVWCDSPNGAQGGIWLSGGALSSDNTGNIFGASGNGTFDANTGGSDYGDSAFSLSLNGPTLSPTSYFTPANQGTLNNDDLDMGVSSMLVLPTQTGPIPHLAIEADKSGTIYLLNRDNLGGYAATNNSPVQSFSVGHTIRTSASFFNNTLYMAPEGGLLSAWTFNPQTELFSTTPMTTSSASFGCRDCGGAGATPVISANGNANAIIWVLDNTARENGPSILRAYDPSNLQSVLYDSSQAANNRDVGGTAIKFTTPVVANGHVYVGGLNVVTVYGELSSYPTVTITANPSSIAPGSSSTLTVATTNATQVTINGSDGSSYTLSPPSGTQSVTPTATTTYTANAVGNNATVKAAATVTMTSGTVSGCVPSGAGVLICAPSAAASIPSPVTITAGAIAQSGTLTALRAYVDNVAVITQNNPSSTKAFQFSQSVAASAGSHYLVIVGYQSTGGTVQTSETFIVSATTGGPTSGCVPASAGAMICAPTPGVSATSPVTITAGALAGSGTIAAIRAYIDNVAALTVNNPSSTRSFQFTHAVAASAGSHSLVVVGYQSTGGTVQANGTFTVGGGTSSCVPASMGAMFCTPQKNATVSSPVSIVAGATTAKGYLAAIRLYVDNVAQPVVNNPQTSASFSINPSISMSTGTHNLVIVGYPSTGGSVSASTTVNVQ